ncbi:MAG: HK97 family phage prohead protease, partial [Alphaproteobacteria bacterium]
PGTGRAADEQVRGYASLVDIADHHHDVVAPGAFRQSLRARGGGQGVRMLWQHDPSQPIGVWTLLVEDDRGLYVEGRLTPEVARAAEAWALIRAGALDGLSIGYNTVRAAADPDTGVRRLLEIDLWEVSLVTFPACPGAIIRRGGAAGNGLGALIASLERAAHTLAPAA